MFQLLSHDGQTYSNYYSSPASLIIFDLDAFPKSAGEGVNIPGDKKEPCMKRNVVYESECSTCNPLGTRKEADKMGLGEKRERPSLYVGETARSVAERALEHWRDAETGKEESHMVEHQVDSHGGEGPPKFSFRVV